jgi:hypothetical protein
MLTAPTRNNSISLVPDPILSGAEHMDNAAAAIFQQEAFEAARLSRKRFALEAKLEAAKIRRDRYLAARERHVNLFNNKSRTIAKRAQQQRWKEDNRRDQQAFVARKTNQEQVMLRKVRIHILLIISYSQHSTIAYLCIITHITGRLYIDL